MKKNKFIYIALCSVGFIACEPEFDQPLEDNPITQEKGDADFSTYISIGNSLTAGFSGGALYRSGQEVAFPNLIATKMKAAGGGEFTTPFMMDDVGGFQGFETAFGTRLVLQTDAEGNRAPGRLNNNVATNDITTAAEGSSFNNFGVPGITSFQFGADGLGNPAGLQTTPISANPYFARFASEPSTSILKDALAKQPTFFTMWLGNNDVLGYATSGGTGVNQIDPSVSPANYGPNDITNPLVFGSVMTNYATALTTNGAKGVIINIPNVTDIPFFTTVPYNPVPLDAPTAAATNQAYAQYNGGLQQAFQALQAINPALFTAEELARRTINFKAGQNAVVIIDEDLTDLGAINPAFAMLPKFRQTTADDLIVLPASSFIGTREVENDPRTTNGVGIPLADQWVLTPEELAAIDTAVQSYNTTLKAITDGNPNLALYDANADLTALASEGITSEGVTVTSTFVTGGAFSLDGVHLSPRGNAVIANRIIGVINDNFNSTLRLVEPSSFPFIAIP